MPCRDPRDDMSYDDGYRAGEAAALSKFKEASKTKLVKDALQGQNRELEAMLCAVIRQLNRHITDGNIRADLRCVLKSAELNAGLKPDSLLDWWKHHDAIDETRMANAIDNFMNNFSEDEKKVLAQLMKDRV